MSECQDSKLCKFYDDTREIGCHHFCNAFVWIVVIVRILSETLGMLTLKRGTKRIAYKRNGTRTILPADKVVVGAYSMTPVL